MAEVDSKHKEDLLVLVSGDKVEYPVRKSQLQKYSDYFKGLFHSGMKECHSDTIGLPTIDSIGLNSVVSFVQDKDLPLCLTNVREVLQASTYLQIDQLTQVCCTFLENKLSPLTFAFVKELGEDFFLKELCESVKCFILNNLKLISFTDNFKTWSGSILCEYLDCDDLFVDEEKDAFDIAIRWVSCKEENRRHASEILDTIRFPLMSGLHLKECSDTLIATDLFGFGERFIKEAMEGHATYLKASKKCQLRCVEECVVALGGFTGSEHSTNRFQLLSLKEFQDGEEYMTRTELSFKSCKDTKLPVTLCEHGVCELNGYIYVAGGQTHYSQDGRYTRNTVYRYDSRFNLWIEVSSMSTPRSLFYLGAFNDELYAVGGWRSPNNVTRSVERYNTVSNSWEFVASLTMGLHEHAGCTHDGTLYISGGYKGPMQGHLDKMWSYDSAVNQWCCRAALRHARSYHAMVSVPGQGVLVAGGVNYLGHDAFEDVRTCEMYDPSSDQWTSVTQCPNFACCMPSLLIKTNLYLFGGHSFESNTDHHIVQILNTSNLQWQQVGMESNKILCFGCVTGKFSRSAVGKFQ